MNPIIKTPRLLLRPPTATDAEAIANNLNDFAVSGNLAQVPHPYRLADAESWLRTRRLDTSVERMNFAVEYQGAYIGQVGFHPGRQGPVVGYWIGQPFWNRGFMTEAAWASLDWYFGQTGATAIYSGVFHFNAASLAIQRKLGFSEIGRSRLHCLARGVEVEHIDTQLTRERFRQLAARSGAASATTAKSVS
ncbi:GNAT family N-acetyltransferase [Devosia rhizoryzae]|uniref:GNAT family N-acetyltransferase n=1 Tax=Devosia rhizoryzae TaxID=2774137 RepID=A0ABX7C9J5_9HYPH|nr:GNAT family N-acetyltransferase [Devosia rhizoryzae]QQR39250.1 GNAT family N-acetyltransferase [Devosia rhizoryzae]